MDTSDSSRDTANSATKQFYHGTRAELNPGDVIAPDNDPRADGPEGIVCVYLTPDLDAAIWEAELANGEGAGRVYVVEPVGRVEDAADVTGRGSPGHPWMSLCSREPVRVVREVAEWPLYHGTRADLKPGDLIEPGRAPNFGDRGRATTYVFMARTLDAAIWGAELAAGQGPGRVYIVEPTGPIEDDPNLTDKKFRGNPTKAFRSREPLRVTGEVGHWQGHAPEIIQAMKDGLARLEQLGVEPLDD